MNQTFFITGANGFIGQHLIHHLSSQGHQVYACIRPNTLPRFYLNERVHVCYADLRNKQSLSRAVPSKAYVIHLAANPYHKTLSHDVNVGGTRNVLEIAKKKNCMQFVQISSQATKIETKGVYATTKLQSDELVRSSGIPYVIVKPSLVYGSGETGLFIKISKLAAMLPFLPVFGDGNIRLFPIHIHDLCVLLEKVALDHRAVGNTFDAGGKDSITYNELYKAIGSFLPKKPTLVHIPKTIGLILAKIFSILPNPPFYEDNILGSTQNTQCNTKLLLARYHHDPISFRNGVREVFDSTKIRIGIVGLGKMGMLHATLLKLMPGVEVVALIDVNPKLYATFQSMGISGRYYASFQEALLHEKLDAVYIITPTSTHLSLLKEAIRQNIHVFIEKPVTVSRQDLTELRTLKSKSVIHAGYTLLYHRTFQELIRIIKEKRYGSIQSYTATFQHGEVLAPKKGWMFAKKLSGGGVLMNPGPHLFSLIQSCFGKPRKIAGSITKIYSIEVEDSAQFTFDHADFQGEISLSWSIPKKNVADYQIRCEFEKAIVIATPQHISITINHKKTQSQTFIEVPQQEKHVFTINPHAYGEAYYLENIEFIRAIQEKSPTKVVNTLDTALRIEDIIHMCYEKGLQQ